MAVENREVPFSVNGREFVGIRRLGFIDGGVFVVDAWTTPPPMPRGSYFTAPPISRPEWRERYRSRAAFRVSEPNRLIVYDDYGKPTTIVAPPDIVSELEAECAASLPRSPAPRAERPHAG